MKLIYDVQDRPPIKETIIFAFQQMIAIMAATLLVPMLMSGFTNDAVHFDPAAALCGAGFGTIVYILFTKGRSPVFLGSSFTMCMLWLFSRFVSITSTVSSSLTRTPRSPTWPPISP